METMTEQALPRGYTVRRPRPEDSGAIADLINANARSVMGVDVTTTDDVRLELDDPTRNLDDDNWLVLDEAGNLAASLLLYQYPPYTTFVFHGYVHPASASLGIGTFLLDTIERRSRREMHRAADGERVVLHTGVWGQNIAAHRLLESRGFNHIRDFRRMEIDVTATPPAPVLPDTLTIREMVRGQDERALYETMESAFADHWGYAPMPFEEFLYNEIEGVADFDPTLVFLAIDGDDVAGAAICRSSHAGDDSVGWVGTLGVQREWRGRGLGQALLLHSFGELHRRGKRTVGLTVDSSSLTGAYRLYERAGMHEVRRTRVYEKELRPAGG